MCFLRRWGMRAFLDELQADFRTAVPFVAWAAISLVVGIAGPFGTYEILPLPLRILVWAAILAVAILTGAAVRAFVRGTLGLRRFLPSSILIALLVTGLFTPVFAALAGRVFAGRPEFRPGLLEIAAFIFCASMAVAAYRQVTAGGPRRAPASAAGGSGTTAAPGPDTAAEPVETVPRLVLRLEPGLRGRLFSVSVRDHYVDVRTEAGRASLLMRLSDAIAETEGEAGAQVHRSHWVARAAVAAVERRGDRTELRLQDGTRIPVSRSHRPQVEGWGREGGAGPADTPKA